jgi:hypothetical protein
VRALAAYLAVYQHLPYDRMAQLFGDVLGIGVSVGALAQMVADSAAASHPASRLHRPELDARGTFGPTRGPATAVR